MGLTMMKINDCVYATLAKKTASLSLYDDSFIIQYKMTLMVARAPHTIRGRTTAVLLAARHYHSRACKPLVLFVVSHPKTSTPTTDQSAHDAESLASLGAGSEVDLVLH